MEDPFVPTGKETRQIPELSRRDDETKVPSPDWNQIPPFSPLPVSSLAKLYQIIKLHTDRYR
jgi:hypothetical protein